MAENTVCVTGEDLHMENAIYCPFCGNQDMVETIEEDKKLPWTVYCGNCSCQIDNYPDRETAIRAWNTRFYNGV